MISPTLAVASFVGWLGGVFAHEVTHYLAARLFGRDAAIDWLGLDTMFDAEGLPEWQHRCILLAPQAVGLSVLVGAVVAGVEPSIGLLPWLLAWTSYTLLGGAADWSVRVSRGEPVTAVASDVLGMESLSQERQEAFLLLYAGAAGMLAGGFLRTGMIGREGGLAALTFNLAAPGILAVGFGLFLAAVIRLESQQENTQAV